MVIPENWRKTLLDMAEKACLHFSIKETTLGNKIVKDADFFPDLRKGAGCGVDKYQQIIAWFKENLPANTPKHSKPPH